jgi:transposase
LQVVEPPAEKAFQFLSRFIFKGLEGMWYSPVQVEGWKRVPFTTQTTSKMTTKKTYSKEFKEEAVRLAEQHGNQSQTARDLGLQLSVLRRWIKEFNQDGEKAFPGKGHSKEEELRQLQRENQRLKETVEILKKAVGIFSKSSQ